MNIPAAQQTVMPYLILKDAAAFIQFLIDVFDATETRKALREGTEIIMHAEMNIGGSTIMLAEGGEPFGVANANLFIYVDNADERYQKALDAGATSLMGLSDQPYGRSCGVTDAFGNVWWITSV